jgi:drug/metabolite transporter (DMT)-like permease
VTSSARRLGGLLFDRPYILLSLTSLFWAINIVLGRFIAGTIPPVTLAWGRWAGAALLVLPFAWPHLRRDWSTIRAHVGLLALLSLTGVTLYNTMAYIGLGYTQALNALLLQSTGPILIAIWCFAIYGERLTGRQMAGIAASLLGVVIIICRGDLSVLMQIELNVGDIWFLSALAIYALYSALLRGRPRMHWLSFLGVTIILGALLLTPAFLWELSTGARPVWSPAAVAVFGYVIIFPSIVAYVFFNRGVELIGANRAGPFFHLMPLFGSVIAILFLGEELKAYHAFGYVLVIAGILLATRKARVQPSAEP